MSKIVDTPNKDLKIVPPKNLTVPVDYLVWIKIVENRAALIPGRPTVTQLVSTQKLV
jgi:hypothetical protein